MNKFSDVTFQTNYFEFCFNVYGKEMYIISLDNIVVNFIRYLFFHSYELL